MERQELINHFVEDNSIFNTVEKVTELTKLIDCGAIDLFKVKESDVPVLDTAIEAAMAKRHLTRSLCGFISSSKNREVNRLYNKFQIYI